MRVMLSSLFIICSFLFVVKCFAEEFSSGWFCQFSENGTISENWTPSKFGNECFKDKGVGYAFYKHIIHVNEVQPSDEYKAVYFGMINDAEEVMLDGKLIGKTGNFPPHYQNAKNVFRIHYLGFGNDLIGKELLVKVYSEFPLRRGLDLTNIRFGEYTRLQKYNYWKTVQANAPLPLIFSVFAITLILMLILIWQDPKKRHRLWAFGTVFFMTSYTFFLSRFGYDLDWKNIIIYKGIVGSAIFFTAFLSFFAVNLSKTFLSHSLIFLGIANVIYSYFIFSESTITLLRVITKSGV